MYFKKCDYKDCTNNLKNKTWVKQDLTNVI